MGNKPQPEHERWCALMRAAQDGDQASYAQLLHDMLPVLRSVLRGRTPPSQLEDVVQDVLLTVHRVRHTYDPDRPFLPWLVAIAQRRAIDAGRREVRRRAGEAETAQEQEIMPVSADPHEPLDQERLTGRLHHAMQSLPRRQRAAVELVKLQELSIAEAAQQAGQTPGAMKVNVHRGIAALRRLLSGEAL